LTVKFLVAGYGSRGDVEPCIAVAGELVRRGHDVQMAVTVPPELSAFTTSLGLTGVPYGRTWQTLLADGDFLQMMENPISHLQQAVEFVSQLCSEKTETLMAMADGVDLLVAGMTEQSIVANIADYYRIPLAVLNFFPAQLLEQSSPGTKASAHAALDQRRALGLPEEAGLSAQPLEIQAYDALCAPKLADEFARGDDRRPFVGAITLELPTDADDEVLSWIAAGQPPVYFGFGSMPLAAPDVLVGQIGETCAQLGERALIHMGPNDFGDIAHPDHVKVVGAVNNATIFPACRAVVHHGGAGTTAAGLRAGIPAMVLWNGLDQPFWSAAVDYLGVGVGQKFSLTSEEILAAGLRMILTPEYGARAREVAAQMNKPAESLSQTADLLEDAAQQRRDG
jgi:vancomycin aglycone glucosyltransferase